MFQEECQGSGLDHLLPSFVFGEGPVDSLINAMTLLKKFHDEERPGLIRSR
jgi:hypothetical protein